MSTSLRSGVSGRVKQIYAQAGDDVALCMLEHGALAVISQDGYLSLEIPAGELRIGDEVTVLRENGKRLTGRVDTVIAGSAAILVTDNGPLAGETVSVLDAEDRELGSGELSIHNPLAVTGFAGTVRSVSVRENQQVQPGTTLFRLTDTSYSAGYDAILKERQQLEKTLLELLVLYQNGALLAPFDGTVLSVEWSDEEESAPSAASASSAYAAYAGMASAASAAAGETPVLTLSRDAEMRVTISVDEADILALQTGQTARVTLSSLGDAEFEGTVTRVDRSPSGEQTPVSGGALSGSMFSLGLGDRDTSGAYAAEITFPKAEHMLPGMTADVAVQIDGTEDVLLVPNEAIHRTSAIAYVYTAYDAETGTFGGAVTVTVGVSNNEYTQITAGLKEGDLVWYTPQRERFPWEYWGY